LKILGRKRKMNFEEWMKEMSKEALFSGDDEESGGVERMNPLAYEDLEEENPKNSEVN
jgi:hypothetical protein